MDVNINGFPIEITLENEKTVNDVVDSVGKWTAERNLIFVGVEIDEQYHNLEEIPDFKIEDVSVLNCLVQSKSDIVYDTVNEGIDYCERVIDYFSNNEKGPGKDELEDLISGLEWLQEVFPSVAAILEMNLSDIKYKDSDIQSYIGKINDFKHSIVEFVAQSDENSSFDFNRAFFEELKEIFAIFLVSEEMRKLVVDSIDSPEVLIATLKNIEEALPDQMKVLEEAAIAYQTGNDKEGVEKLFEFIDFMFGYTRTCYQMAPVFTLDYDSIEINGISLNEKNRELHNLLNDTLEIVENNDMISLADILEYEMMEAIENLEAYISSIFEKIGV